MTHIGNINFLTLGDLGDVCDQFRSNDGFAVFVDPVQKKWTLIMEEIDVDQIRFTCRFSLDKDTDIGAELEDIGVHRYQQIKIDWTLCEWGIAVYRERDQLRDVCLVDDDGSFKYYVHGRTEVWVRQPHPQGLEKTLLPPHIALSE